MENVIHYIIVSIYCCVVALTATVPIEDETWVLFKNDVIVVITPIEILNISDASVCAAACDARNKCQSIIYRNGSCVLYNNELEKEYIRKKSDNKPPTKPPIEVEANETCDSIISKFGIELVTNTTDWATAKQGCIDKGKQLVKIDFERKFECVKEFLHDVDISAWIGLKYNHDEKSYQWMDNETLNENCTFWADGEPRSTGVEGRECIQLWVNQGWKWDDEFCSYQHYYICEN